MSTKICSSCESELPVTSDHFHKSKASKDGFMSICKSCNKQKARKHRKENKDKHLEYCKEWRNRNHEYGKKYKQKNLAKTRQRERDRYKNDLDFRIKKCLRSRLYQVVKFKFSSVVKLVGCSLDELKSHLEKQFTNGMSWDNYGEWHIDHVRPCCSFDLADPEQQERCFHYTNLQPLWAKDNLAKGGR